jgi:hypothetical protein
MWPPVEECDILNVTEDSQCSYYYNVSKSFCYKIMQKFTNVYYDCDQQRLSVFFELVFDVSTCINKHGLGLCTKHSWSYISYFCMILAIIAFSSDDSGMTGAIFSVCSNASGSWKPSTLVFDSSTV